MEEEEYVATGGAGALVHLGCAARRARPEHRGAGAPRLADGCVAAVGVDDDDFDVPALVGRHVQDATDCRADVALLVLWWAWWVSGSVRSDPSPGSQKGRICAKLRERTAAIHSYVPELGSRLSMMVAVVPLIVVLSLQKQKTREEKEGRFWWD